MALPKLCTNIQFENTFWGDRAERGCVFIATYWHMRHYIEKHQGVSSIHLYTVNTTYLVSLCHCSEKAEFILCLFIWCWWKSGSNPITSITSKVYCVTWGMAHTMNACTHPQKQTSTQSRKPLCLISVLILRKLIYPFSEECEISNGDSMLVSSISRLCQHSPWLH